MVNLWQEHYWEEDWQNYPRILVSGPLASIYQKASIMVMGQPLHGDSSENEQASQKSVTLKQQKRDVPGRPQPGLTFNSRSKGHVPFKKYRLQGGTMDKQDEQPEQQASETDEQHEQLEWEERALDGDSIAPEPLEQQKNAQEEQQDRPALKQFEHQESAAVEPRESKQVEQRHQSDVAVMESQSSAAMKQRQINWTEKEQRGLFKELSQRVAQLKSLGRVEDVLAYAKTLLAVESKVWDANPWLLGTKQGVIDLRTGTPRPGRPNDYIRTIIPTKWKGLDEPAPRFEQFLREIFADRAENERDELIAFLQRALGYGITGNVNEHVFLMLYGEEGRNGKSTLMHALEHVLGRAVGAVSQDELIAGGRFSTPGNAKPHLCSLQGKRIAWVSEPSEHARFAINQIKLLTGGGGIVARQLYGKEFTFKPSHLLILLSNHKPEADAADRAFWEHLCPIVFNQRFVAHPERANEQLRDPSLARDLEAEASGILAWLVRGTLEWHRIGLAIPESVRLARQEYRSGESTIEDFVRDCCVLDAEAQAPAGALYRAYRAWASENGLTPVSNKQFELEMKQIDSVVWQRAKRHNLYTGIKLSVENEVAD